MGLSEERPGRGAGYHCLIIGCFPPTRSTVTGGVCSVLVTGKTVVGEERKTTPAFAGAGSRIEQTRQDGLQPVRWRVGSTGAN